MKERRMIRIQSLLLALLMVFALAACTQAGTGETTQLSEAAQSASEGAQSGEAEASAAVPASAGPQYGGVLNVVWEAASETFDPHYTTGWVSYIWSQQIYESPLARDNDGNICPNVCDFEFSDDNLTLKLRVREGVTFHDGTPVTIEDVVASLERASMVADLKRFFTDYVVSSEVADGTVTYKFSEYSPMTVYYISGHEDWAAVLPAAVCAKYGEKPITDIADAVGTGPYKLVSGTPGVVFNLERYEGYVPVPEGHDGLAAPKMAYMDKINVYVNEDATSCAMSLLNGEYDAYTMSDEYAEMAAAKGLDHTMANLYNLIFMVYNTKGDRPVNDPNLRKAIAAALDCESLLKVDYDGVYTNEMSPMNGIYYTDKFNKADYAGAANIELAKKYLAESDYKGEELLFLINTTGTTAAVVAQSQLSEAGINSRVEYKDAVTIKQYYGDNSNPYDMVVLGTIVGSYNPAALSANIRTIFWGSEEKDALFAQLAATVSGSDESVQAWEKLTDLWVNECGILNVGRTGTKWYHNADLVLNMDGPWHYFWNAYWTDPAAHQK